MEQLDELELDLVKTLVKMDLLESKETLKYITDKEEKEVLVQNIRLLESIIKKLKKWFLKKQNSNMGFVFSFGKCFHKGPICLNTGFLLE